MKIYVGNLSFDTTESQLREVFGQFGEIDDLTLVTDRDTGRPKGFGFLEMDDQAAREAIAALDGKEVAGRTIKVNEARPKTEHSGRRPG
ncbi:MAG: RNA-binding protein [Gammaproteobacteria bacterium]